MANNASLHRAKDAKNDEFYTRLEDIENELRHYRAHFEGKTVFCNCDDPFESNFFKYFALNFNFLKLKKLICTCYAGSPISHTEFADLPIFREKEKLPYVMQITEVKDLNNDGAVDLDDVIETLLRNDNNNLSALDGDGDFRSPESISFLEEADIVVTNPPFSLFRDFIAQLMEYDKKFIILGNINAITYKEFFPLIKEGKVWAGYSFNKTIEFIMPDSYEMKGKSYIDAQGKKHGFVPAICWYTNLDIDKRHEELILYKKYTPEEYPKYDNYDAINVGKTSDIPMDYLEIMGVPITFLDKYNPSQFELIGEANHGCDSSYDLFKPTINGRLIFKRLLIKRRRSQ